MLDDFLSGYESNVDEIKHPPQTTSTYPTPPSQPQQPHSAPQSYEQRQEPRSQYQGGQNSYQGNQGNQGGYQNNNRGGGYQGGNNWKNNRNNNDERIQAGAPPYIPVSVFFDKDFPHEVKNKLKAIASRLVNKGYTVRYSADEKPLHDELQAISSKFMEAFAPWKGFSEIDTKHGWNTEFSKHLASQNFPGWERVPDVVKALMARNVRMLFGDKNNSISLMLITWSPDGASRPNEVTKDTGRAGFIIKLAGKYGFPVLNLAAPNADAILEKYLGI